MTEVEKPRLKVGVLECAISLAADEAIRMLEAERARTALWRRVAQRWWGFGVSSLRPATYRIMLEEQVERDYHKGFGK